MKKILLLNLLLLISICGFAQRDTIVDKKCYKVWYSQKYKQPLKVEYKLYKLDSKVERGSMNFYKEKGIKTSEDKDYKMNEFDKGHLTPAEDMSYSEESMKASFSYLNCTLQHSELNRGCWKSLEEQIRKWSYNDSLKITVEVIFTSNKQKKVMYNKYNTAIPIGFKKTVMFLSNNKKHVFYFPNQPCKGDYIPFKQ